ncbi:MAG: UbiA-like polyprenyltransferase [Bacteroidia bacterium]|nr:putative 4-hydroxybenzoate polyprenyltransferase [Bacteroidia bacterium]MDW8157789.1 UbiA-like polyprenyltransferase [Bacteroidia bacterium]
MKVIQYLSFIKFSHTIFAFPFALIGFFWAYEKVGQFSWYKLLYVALCMVFARSAAMGFNRLVDRKYDSQNVRTAMREIPAGIISVREATAFIILNVMGFITCSWLINETCFYLSPIALLVILGYSYTKRFTALCHIVLGLALALAPLGAYLAVAEKLTWEIIGLAWVVLCWVSGFDILYALQDVDFDKAHGLKSIPVALGKQNAIWFSRLLHFIVFLGIFVLGVMSGRSFFYLIGAFIFSLFLIYQHTLVKPNDLSKINLAFFTSNGIASIVFGIFTILDILVY